MCALATSPAAARPTLAVVMVFDQLRSAELERYAPFFGPGGFGGMDGAHHDAIYSYAGTETGPGHATIATGANPEVHGIVTNQWFMGKVRRYVVDDPAFPVLGASDGSGRSPRMLVAPTLGDTMKAESGGRAKVYAISLKDRGAILAGGSNADLALWYDPNLGRYTTSTAYAEALPPWIADLAASLPVATMGAPPWTPLPIPAELAHLAPADDRPGEAGAAGLSRTFPHDVAGQPEATRRKLYRMRPESIDDLFTLALRVVDEAALGRDGEPDLLVVSVSATDYIGHSFGPDSMEQLDLLRRADASVRRFLAALATRIPRRQLVLALSSDHGGAPLPASAVGRVPQPADIPATAVLDAAAAAAKRSLPPGLAANDGATRILGFQPPHLFLDEDGLSPELKEQLRNSVADAVAKVPGIARVYDLSRSTATDVWEPLMRASTFPGRTGQLLVRQNPRVVFLDNPHHLGTDHGTPYLYDRRVPLLITGPGVRRGRYAKPVDPRDLAPTVAFLLGVPPPDMAQGTPVPSVEP